MPYGILQVSPGFTEGFRPRATQCARSALLQPPPLLPPTYPVQAVLLDCYFLCRWSLPAFTLRDRLALLQCPHALSADGHAIESEVRRSGALRHRMWLARCFHLCSQPCLHISLPPLALHRPIRMEQAPTTPGASRLRRSLAGPGSCGWTPPVKCDEQLSALGARAGLVAARGGRRAQNRRREAPCGGGAKGGQSAGSLPEDRLPDVEEGYRHGARVVRTFSDVLEEALARAAAPRAGCRMRSTAQIRRLCSSPGRASAALDTYALREPVARIATQHLGVHSGDCSRSLSLSHQDGLELPVSTVLGFARYLSGGLNPRIGYADNLSRTELRETLARGRSRQVPSRRQKAELTPVPTRTPTCTRVCMSAPLGDIEFLTCPQQLPGVHAPGAGGHQSLRARLERCILEMAAIPKGPLVCKECMSLHRGGDRAGGGPLRSDTQVLYCENCEGIFSDHQECGAFSLAPPVPPCPPSRRRAEPEIPGVTEHAAPSRKESYAATARVAAGPGSTRDKVVSADWGSSTKQLNEPGHSDSALGACDVSSADFAFKVSDDEQPPWNVDVLGVAYGACRSCPHRCTGYIRPQGKQRDCDDSGAGAVTWSKEKLPDSDDNDDAGVTDSKHDIDTASPKWEPASPEYDDTEDDVSEFDDLVADDAEEQAEARKLKRLGLQLIMDDKGELIWVPKGTSPTSPVQPGDQPITEQKSEAISEDAPASVVETVQVQPKEPSGPDTGLTSMSENNAGVSEVTKRQPRKYPACWTAEYIAHLKGSLSMDSDDEEVQDVAPRRKKAKDNKGQ
ncbi:hypothetical protein CYMTET_25675 [Cymbomonas tetramitiformis]|uniref:Uncharacterized protein n=1 Tax=Cymbomonas tetramitiformis TaxID=36881 RepID=A0AAE0FTY0_9CHLO|nr:hypothetical protein CYMTET_25675 [Cymbomonas tetramitiformis]